MLQHEPQGGPYCIYTRRQPGELNYKYTHEGAYQVDVSLRVLFHGLNDRQ